MALPNFKDFLGFIKGLSKTSQTILAFLMLFFTVILLSIFLGKDIFHKWMDSYYDEQKLEAEFQKELEQFRDSLKQVEISHFWRRSIADELEIREICEKYARIIEGETQLTLYKIHDHGDPFSPNNNALVTVKWSNLNVIQDNYQAEPMYTGGLWASKQALDNGFHFIPDIEKEPNYWRGREQAFHETIGSKSAMFVFVKETLDGVWFVAVHWNRTDPYYNADIPSIRLGQMRTALKPLIYEVPEEFRN